MTMREVAAEKVLSELDTLILTRYNQWKRGVRAAYDQLDELQDFRMKVWGEKLALNMNMKPEGAGRMIF